MFGNKDTPKFYVRPSESDIISFADKHLAPYTIRNGELIANTCPFCKGGERGDQRTFFLSTVTGQYICHRAHCSKSGGFPSLLKHFGESAGIKSIRKSLSTVAARPKERTAQIDAYFADRGISTATLDAYQIGADNNGNIMFPFYVEGELVYAKYRKPRPPAPKERKEWQEANTTPVLLGMDLCDPNLPLTITEGQVDCLSLYEAGLCNVVSVPCGCENLDWVEPCWEWLEQFSQIVLFGDNDAPGKKMVRTLAARLGEERCLMVEDYPEDCKDANDILLKEGEFSLLDVWKNAKEVPIRGVIDLADVPSVDPTTVPRIPTGIPALDESLNGLEEGAVTVFTGE